MTQYHSRVVACWHALDDLLRSVVDVTVEFGWPGEAPAAETVTIVPKTTGTAEQEQESFGPGSRRGQFGLVVQISTIDHKDAWSAVDRLDDLQRAVEAAIRISTAGPSRSARPDVDGVLWWQVSATNEHAFGHPEGFGWWARTELIITVQTKI